MLNDLIYIEGLKGYVRIHTSNGAVITYQTLTYFEEKLSGDRFVRVHRSFIVSLDHISAFSASHLELGKSLSQLAVFTPRKYAVSLNHDVISP
jgi:DNA-binding LytR/AlgR family response regulator